MKKSYYLVLSAIAFLMTAGDAYSFTCGGVFNKQTGLPGEQTLRINQVTGVDVSDYAVTIQSGPNLSYLLNRSKNDKVLEKCVTLAAAALSSSRTLPLLVCMENATHTVSQCALGTVWENQ